MELIIFESDGEPAFLIDGTPISASAVPPLSNVTTIRIRFFDEFVGAFFTNRKEELNEPVGMPIELAIFSPGTAGSMSAFEFVWSLLNEKIAAINSVDDRANNYPVFYDLGPYFDTMPTVDFLCQASSLSRINGTVVLEPILHWISQQQGFIKYFTMYPSAGGTQVSEVDFSHFLLRFFNSRGAPPASYNAMFKHGVVADDVKTFSITKGGHSLRLETCVAADGSTDWALKSLSAEEEALSNVLVIVQACPVKRKIILEESENL